MPLTLFNIDPIRTKSSSEEIIGLKNSLSNLLAENGLKIPDSMYIYLQNGLFSGKAYPFLNMITMDKPGEALGLHETLHILINNGFNENNSCKSEIVQECIDKTHEYLSEWMHNPYEQHSLITIGDVLEMEMFGGYIDNFLEIDDSYRGKTNQIINDEIEQLYQRTKCKIEAGERVLSTQSTRHTISISSEHDLKKYTAVMMLAVDSFTKRIHEFKCRPYVGVPGSQLSHSINEGVTKYLECKMLGKTIEDSNTTGQYKLWAKLVENKFGDDHQQVIDLIKQGFKEGYEHKYFVPVFSKN